MNDELKKLEKAFAKAPDIQASSKAKQAAIAAAMVAFEEEKALGRQGKAIENRQKEHDHKNSGLSTFAKWRESMKLIYVLPGAAALATIALVAVNTFQFQSLFIEEKGASGEGLGEIVKKPAKTAELKAREEARLQLKSAPTAVTVLVDNASRQSSQYDFHVVLPEHDNLERRPLPSLEIAMLAASDTIPAPQLESLDGDTFKAFEQSPLKFTSRDPVSTFSIDVDTASYAYMRASLNRGLLPAKDAVRIEELINYFPYDYPAPADKQTPFKVNTTVMPNPWNKNTKLLHIGIKGYDTPAGSAPRSNLVFLLDVSGSMNQPNKLPLLKNSLKLLLSRLAADDTISIVAYAGNAGTVLEPTKVKNKAMILKALSRVEAGGSTAGGEGIELAYQLAEENFDPDAVNRIILATDGDFNVGISDPEALKRLVERKRKSGISLSVLGFGKGNYNDELMQTLAQNGNGNAAYIDSLSEARKVLVEEASSTLFTIAKDVKIQLEFNPAAISEYRLIGYETRQLNREDFNNDKVDAGDIGSGHTVTAIYEITPAGSTGKLVDDLRYQSPKKPASDEPLTEYGFLKLRYKLPNQEVSQLVQHPIRLNQEVNDIEAVSDDVRFATAVAAYGQLLSGGTYTGSYHYDDVIDLAQGARGQDEFGYRSEFINLVRLAKAMDTAQSEPR